MDFAIFLLDDLDFSTRDRAGEAIVCVVLLVLVYRGLMKAESVVRLVPFCAMLPGLLVHVRARVRVQRQMFRLDMSIERLLLPKDLFARWIVPAIELGFMSLDVVPQMLSGDEALSAILPITRVWSVHGDVGVEGSQVPLEMVVTGERLVALLKRAWELLLGMCTHMVI
jgi:hypothetical protein